jgi:thiamine-phosphate diphosphorylase
MRFLNCGIRPLGIYPVVDRAYKLTTLYEAGVTTAQLRVKDMQGSDLENEIIEAICISSEYNTRIFINDFWELAIKHKAYGVHLGQEDIQDANIQAIYRNDLRLGISTHTTEEINIALGFEPSYVAIGPIYETNSKEMVYNPVGLEDLRSWSNMVDYPIVAIGGINLDNLEEVLKTGAVDGAAMIAAVLDEQKEVSRFKTIMLVDRFNRVINEPCQDEISYGEIA